MIGTINLNDKIYGWQQKIDDVIANNVLTKDLYP